MKLLQFCLELLLFLEQIGIELYSQENYNIDCTCLEIELSLRTQSSWNLQNSFFHNSCHICSVLLLFHVCVYSCMHACAHMCVCARTRMCVLIISEVCELSGICSHGIWDLIERRPMSFSSQLCSHHPSHPTFHTLPLCPSYKHRLLCLDVFYDMSTTTTIVRQAWRQKYHNDHYAFGLLYLT